MTKVYFEPNHWKNPRKTIANVYENNDYGYVFHATSILIDILEFANLSILDCKTIKALDYGCGTGRVTRQFALTGAYIEGYDPITECIIESEKEFQKIGDRYKKPALFTDNIEKVGNNFNLIFCVNVLEHLNDELFETAMSNIEDKLAEDGRAILWIHASKNEKFCTKYNLNPGGKLHSIFIVSGTKVNGVMEYKQVFRK